MNDDILLALSYKTERAASRRLMASGLSQGEALHQTLTRSAGRQGLVALLAERTALQAHVQLRADARAASSGKQRTMPAHGATAWRAWFDGSAHPNPGRCSIGFVLRGPNGECIERARPAGYGNSSEAEYHALIALLQAAVAHGAHGLTVHGDSRVVIDDMALPARLSAPSLRSLHAAAHAQLAQLREVRLRWIPRHQNGEADALSQRARCMHPENPDEH